VEKLEAPGNVSGCVLSGCVLTGPSHPYDDWYIEVFGIADYESIVTFAKFKMADTI